MGWLFYDKVKEIVNRKDEWSHDELRKELANGVRFTKDDYFGLLKELKKNGEVQVGRQKVKSNHL